MSPIRIQVPGLSRVPGKVPRSGWDPGPASQGWVQSAVHSPGRVETPDLGHRVMYAPQPGPQCWVPTPVPGSQVGSGPSSGSQGRVGSLAQVPESGHFWCPARVHRSGRDAGPGSPGHVGSPARVPVLGRDHGPRSADHDGSPAWSTVSGLDHNPGSMGHVRSPARPQDIRSC